MFTFIEKFFKTEELIMLELFQVFNKVEKKSILIIQKFFIIMTKLGDGFLYPLLIISIIAFGDFKETFLYTFIFGFTIERIFYHYIKKFTKRIRPFEKLKIYNIPVLPPDKYSFPSGHTSAAFLFATTISLFFPVLTILVFIFAFLVGLSRIILNLHYPTDVLIGSQIGISISLISYEIINILL